MMGLPALFIRDEKLGLRGLGLRGLEFGATFCFLMLWLLKTIVVEKLIVANPLKGHGLTISEHQEQGLNLENLHQENVLATSNMLVSLSFLRGQALREESLIPPKSWTRILGLWV